MDELAAFVLAGGKSSRMGRDKAFLSFGGETLLSRALKLASAVAERVSVVGDVTKFAGFGPVVTDIYADRGPLGGIHAALSATSAEQNLILAVDLPFLDLRFVEYLVAEAQKSAVMVTVPHIGGGFQPLCAIYRRDFRSLADEALRNGKNKIDLLFAEINPRIIAEGEFVRSGFSAEMFRNLNTPQDVAQAAMQMDRKP
jgi:molybdenum cofactor guanylyltransferase